MPVDSFLLPTLLGLRLCFTGFMEPDERDAYPDLAVKLGAIVDKDMAKKKCTHLVAKSATGAKYT